MLKSMNFFRGKSRGRVIGGTKLALLAPVILGLVHRILFQQGSNLVNKLALLLNKCRGRGLSAFCMFFKYHAPAGNPAPSPAGGEGLHRPWCHKILGTDCASRPSMTGGRGANSFGRSMIEMLGVLAIIGVLSVGGIAGYSKAMMMWRSNVQKNMLTELISGVIRFQSNLPPDIGDAPEIDLTPMLGAMGLLPEETKYDDNWIQDKYGIRAQVGYGYGLYFIRLYYVPTAGEGISPYQELCRNVVQVIKPLANQIKELRSWKTESENSSYSIIYYGKDLASETVEETNRKCKNVAFGVHMTIIFNSK